jgi:NodT family efflux transporter outer membrane factor (OMF) lipoprotein
MASPQIKTWFSALAVCLAQASCAPLLDGITLRDVDASVPESFGTAAATLESTAALPIERFFQDANLIALIEQALANNQELNILEMEVAIANAEVMARIGEYLPRVSFDVGAGLERVGRYTSQGASDAADEITPGRTVPENLPSYRLGFFASWEIDLWGRLRRATRAAMLRTSATLEGRNYVITRLVAEIARSYYELLALDNELVVLERNIEIQNQALAVVRAQKLAARVTELAVQRFEAELLHNQSRLFDVRQQIVETENRINLLVGRFPQPITRSSTTFLTLEPTSVATGLPAQLLANRPDLRQAELQLAAADLDVSVARARYYPSLSIESGVGVEAFEISRLSTWPESIFYGAFAGISAPLLNRKAINAGWYSANAQRMQAVLHFEQTLRTAFAEAANQIAMIENLGQKYALKAEQVDLLSQAIDVSNRLFASARADYMEVLLTRRDALESQLELIETKKLQLGAVVNMYQALGGGWRRVDEPGSAATESGGTEDQDHDR